MRFFLTCTLILSALAFNANAAKPDTHSLKLNEYSLRYSDGVLELFRKRERILSLKQIRFNYLPAKSWSVLSSDHNKLIVRGEYPAQADFYKHVNDTKPRDAELTITVEDNAFRIQSSPEWARQTTLRFQYLNDHFFGLSEPLQPDNRLSADLTGGIIDVDIVAEHASMKENYASAYSAFYMSTHGYGSFFDTFARGRYQFAINDTNEIHHDTGKLDWYLFPGRSGVEIHRAYYRVIGQPKSVPAWALGPVGWRDQNDGGAKEILEDVKRLSALEIPFTAWFVDRPYSDGAHAWSKMNFNKNFAEPGQWIDKLRNHYNLEFMTWTSPATFGDPALQKHLAGKFTYMDLSHEETAQSFKSVLKEQQYAYGVKGHKIDRGDENFPVMEDWHDGRVAQAERRNKYSYLMAKVHDEALRDAWGEDQVTFARAAIHRTQPYLSAIWAGDPRTSWEGLQANYANAIRSSFMGFPVWGTDVGGYQGEGFIPEDLYLRWMQAGSVSGLFEIKLDGAGGDGRDRMPWQYDEQFQQRFKAVCDDRMKYLPYLYSLSHTSADTGVLMQPLAYRHMSDPKTYDIWDQFYFGPAIMAAPVLTKGNSRGIYFPAGRWRDIDHTGKVFKGDSERQIDVPDTKLPRYVNRNSIYVTGNIFSGSDRLWQSEAKQLTVHAYPGRKGQTTMFTYVDALDGDQHKEIKLTSKKDIHITAPAMVHDLHFEIVTSKKPKALTQNGVTLPYSYDSERQLVRFSLAANQAVDAKLR